MRGPPLGMPVLVQEAGSSSGFRWAVAGLAGSLHLGLYCRSNLPRVLMKRVQTSVSTLVRSIDRLQVQFPAQLVVPSLPVKDRRAGGEPVRLAWTSADDAERRRTVTAAGHRAEPTGLSLDPGPRKHQAPAIPASPPPCAAHHPRERKSQ